MIPAKFEYHAPKSLEEAVQLLERHGGEAKLLAGGHSLLPLMKLRLSSPRFVIDLRRLRGFDEIREEGDKLSLGALTTHAQVAKSELLRSQCPLLPATARHIGDVQVRNRGTLGGSLAHADPAADYPAAILALDAEIVAANGSGSRTIAARNFFVDMLTTALRPGEILTHVRLPKCSPRTGWAYEKLPQPASGFAIVGVAVRLDLDAMGKIASPAVALTGVAPRAFRAEEVEKALAGGKPSEKLFADAAQHVVNGIEPLGDLHASAEYRAAMAVVFTRRAIARAAERAGPLPQLADASRRHGARR
jgi:aerobic carbon-monoxide dehydrogenase medium subunit